MSYFYLTNGDTISNDIQVENFTSNDICNCPYGQLNGIIKSCGTRNHPFNKNNACIPGVTKCKCKLQQNIQTSHLKTPIQYAKQTQLKKSVPQTQQFKKGVSQTQQIKSVPQTQQFKKGVSQTQQIKSVPQTQQFKGVHQALHKKYQILQEAQEIVPISTKHILQTYKSMLHEDQIILNKQTSLPEKQTVPISTLLTDNIYNYETTPPNDISSYEYETTPAPTIYEYETAPALTIYGYETTSAPTIYEY